MLGYLLESLATELLGYWEYRYIPFGEHESFPRSSIRYHHRHCVIIYCAFKFFSSTPRPRADLPTTPTWLHQMFAIQEARICGDDYTKPIGLRYTFIDKLELPAEMRRGGLQLQTLIDKQRSQLHDDGR
jgi:hypothetical protein